MTAKLNDLLIKSMLVGALGGLLFGFDSAVISGAVPSLRILFILTPIQVGVTVSSALAGTVVGAMLAGLLGEHLGGRESLRVCAVCYVVSALGCALAPTWSFLLIVRFIGGLGIGGSSVLGPVYIAELSPAKLRGRMVGAFQINIVVGILTAYVSNYIISLAAPGSNEWRWQLGIAALPAVLFLILLYGVPRSGRWLVTKGRVAEARSVLCQLGADHPDAELAEIVSSIHPEQSTEIEPLFQRKYRQPIILAMLLAAFNQLVGINAVMYYLNDIFLMAGFSRSSSGLQAVFIGLTNLIATLLAMSVIDKIGRKTLLLVGSVGMILSLSGVSFIFLTHRYEKNLLPLLIAYIFSFAISQGAVIWVFISEIFPNRVRAKGQSLGSSTHWVMNTLTAGVFPLFVAHSAGLPFVFFAAMAAVQFVMVFLIFPETKGVSLEELQKKLNIAF